MAHTVTLYGALDVGEVPSHHAYNRKVLECLPTKAELLEKRQPIYIHKEIFAISDVPIAFRSQIIHYGNSYKEHPDFTQGWLSCFEKLLTQLIWLSATVSIETELTGSYSFEWYFDEAYAESYLAEPAKPTVHWIRSGGLVDDNYETELMF